MIADTFESFGWNVTLQNFTYSEVECVNIIAKWNSENSSPLLLGAHYDTRPPGSSDPGSGVGANDGASGVAVLLELADVLPSETRSSVEIVLFDAEDSGGISGWDWIQGSTHYVSQLSFTRRNSIQAMILVDMVGDTNLRLPRESNSATYSRPLQDAIWNTAEQLGHNDTFLEISGWSVNDDHRPFIDAGIPAVDLIHTPFPWYWHTLEDTPDKCSAESLQIVGEVLEVFVVEYANSETTFLVNDSGSLLITIGVIVFIAVPAIILIMKRK
jgi:Zn-dependent M28 family amino/carboxypeptidase